MKKILVLIFGTILCVAVLAGCGKNNDTVETCIVAGESYAEQATLEAAVQPESLAAGHTAYTSAHFVESPKGMQYTVKWYLNDTQVKTETKPTEKDLQDTLVYELEAKKVVAGSLKVEVLYNDTVLLTKELTVK